MTTGRTVNIDLYRDLISFLRSELTRLGYKNAHKPNSGDLLRTYLDISRRLVPPKPRSVHKAMAFSCPAKFHHSLSQIERSIENGTDITRYLSTRIMRLSYNDRMLNDWGVHHLHLGDRIQRNGFIERTQELLFCKFEQDDVYFIDILSHDDFSEQNLVVIMHENWPNMLRRHRLNGIKGAPITNAEISVLRDKNCNYSLQMSDGTVYAPPGGGMAGNGTNAMSVVRASRMCDLLRWEQELIVKNIEEIAAKALRQGAVLPKRPSFAMILQDGVFCAVERSSRVAIRLKEFSLYALG